MSLRLLIRVLTCFLVPLACLASVYLYLYPIWFGCAFPSTHGIATTTFRQSLNLHLSTSDGTEASQNVTTDPFDLPPTAPFRFLVLADPQLEGDSSLPAPEDALSYRLKEYWNRLRRNPPTQRPVFGGLITEIVQELVTSDLPRAFQTGRKQLDLLGNDYYLAHIFRTLHWWTRPTHVTVLGDLIGSQWVDDEEFEWRAWRYWNRVMRNGQRIEDNLTRPDEHANEESGTRVLDTTNPQWQNHIINVAGNHDIGYAGDITEDRIRRFERAFGTSNWDVKFSYPRSLVPVDYGKQPPELHIVVLNDLLLDTPTRDSDAQDEVYEYLNSLVTQRVCPVEDRSAFTLLLTHVPLHKPEGICVDAPFFDYWGDDDGGGAYMPHGLKEQNHLSEHASQNVVLSSIYGMSGDQRAPHQGKGRQGLVLTGHDHEGCDTWHYIPANSTFPESRPETDPELEPAGEVESHAEHGRTIWAANRWKDAITADSHTGIREITLRSMMGDFGGNAGLLSLWFDFENQEWAYDIQMCPLGVQHTWWAVHVIDVVALGLLVAQLVLWSLDVSYPSPSAADLERMRIKAVKSQ